MSPAGRKPEDPAGSWYTPDQTVGFWIRRMAHETVIHRIDELLKVFVAYSVAERSGYFTGHPGRLAGPDVHGADRRRGLAGADRPGAVRRPGRRRRRPGQRDRERPAGGPCCAGCGTGRAPASRAV
jgi:hypothetical protein